jgi:hypothetical protein
MEFGKNPTVMVKMNVCSLFFAELFISRNINKGDEI